MENCSQIQIKSIEKASHTLKKLSAALLAFIMLFAAACKFGDIDFDVTKSAAAANAGTHAGTGA